MKSGASTSSICRSSIIRGVVHHWRALPRTHSFSYPMLMVQLDVDELEAPFLNSFLLRYNRWGVCSIWSDDYLTGSETLRVKVESTLKSHGCCESPERITLITMPRYFGYVFNPVSFFVCFDAQDRVLACITQVNNTFGETHVYPLVCKPSAIPVSWSFPKDFFVSPFFDRQGIYTLEVGSEGEKVLIKVDLERDAAKAFSAILEGDTEKLTKFNLFKALIRYPITVLLTMPRIHLEALFLYFRAKATPFVKPIPSGPYTIKSNQNIIHRMRLALLSLLRAVR